MIDATAASPDDPSRVIVGAYINDIQELDFKTNSCAVDLSSLPEVDYPMMLDKIYLLGHFFIIISLAHVVATSWRSGNPKAEA